MKIVIRYVVKLIGILLIIAAILRWATFSYPDVVPFWPGAIFAPGMLAQVLNWIIVCILGTVGYLIFSLGNNKQSPQR